MDREKIKRINVLKIPIDIIQPEDIESVIKSMAIDGKNHQIILLSASDLMRARRSNEFRTMICGASLVIPISKSIINAAKFLKRQIPIRYEPFDFIVKVLAALERWNKSVYLFGSSQKGIVKAAKNIKTTFPGLKVVGGHASNVPKHLMLKIVESIRKATPTLLMVGNGVPGRERWIPRNMKHFNSGIQMWCSDVLEVFAERRFRPSEFIFKHGLEWFYYFPKKPWTIFRIFPAIWMSLVTLWYRIRRK